MRHQRSLLLDLTILAALGAVVAAARALFGDALGAVGVAFAVTPVIDAAAWVEKLIRKVQGAAQDWEAGVRNPSTSPVGGMKKAKGRFKTEMQAALNEDRWGKAIDRLTDEEIAAAAIAAGGARFVQGVTSRQPKVLAAVQALQPKVAALKARLDAMPVDTDQQREQKMLEAMRGMKAIGRELAGLAR